MNYVALVDDHALLRQGLAKVIDTFEGYKVLLQADNGKHFIDTIKISAAPAIVLLDISMPVMDGYQTAQWIKANLPETKILALTMLDDETSIIKMLTAGATGYILKSAAPKDLKIALDIMVERGIYLSDLVSNTLMHTMRSVEIAEPEKQEPKFSEKELQLISLLCTEKSSRQIAEEMQLGIRTLEGHKCSVYSKTQTSTRVGLVMYAIKNQLIEI